MRTTLPTANLAITARSFPPRSHRAPQSSKCGTLASRTSLVRPERTFGHKKVALGRRGLRCLTTVMAAAVGEKSVLVPVGNGSEEMEAVIIVDVLRRSGAKVTVASVESDLAVTCSRGVKLVADKTINECKETTFDLIALPGGMPGAERLRDSEVLSTMLANQNAAGSPYAAICAAPAVVLESKGLLNGIKATSHPAFVDQLTDKSNADERVVVDGSVTTSRGPGTAFEFALSLVKQLYGEEKMKEVAGPMVMYDHNV